MELVGGGSVINGPTKSIYIYIFLFLFTKEYISFCRLKNLNLSWLRVKMQNEKKLLKLKIFIIIVVKSVSYFFPSTNFSDYDPKFSIHRAKSSFIQLNAFFISNAFGIIPQTR